MQIFCLVGGDCMANYPLPYILGRHIFPLLVCENMILKLVEVTALYFVVGTLLWDVFKLVLI